MRRWSATRQPCRRRPAPVGAAAARPSRSSRPTRRGSTALLADDSVRRSSSVRVPRRPDRPRRRCGRPEFAAAFAGAGARYVAVDADAGGAGGRGGGAPAPSLGRRRAAAVARRRGRRRLLQQRLRARARARAAGRRAGPGHPARWSRRAWRYTIWLVALGRPRDVAVALPRRRSGRSARYARQLRAPAEEPRRREPVPGLGRRRAALGRSQPGHRAARGAAALLPALGAPAWSGCPGCARSRPGTCCSCCAGSERGRAAGAGHVDRSGAWSTACACSPAPSSSSRSPSARRPGRIVADTKLDLVRRPRRGSSAGRCRPGTRRPPSASCRTRRTATCSRWVRSSGSATRVGLPAWVVQRLWWSLLLAGRVRRLLPAGRGCSALGTPRRDASSAALAYALAPRIVTELGADLGRGAPAGRPAVGARSRWCAAARGGSHPPGRGGCPGSPSRASAASTRRPRSRSSSCPCVWLLTPDGRARGGAGCSAGGWLAVVLATPWWVLPLLVLGRYAYPFLDYIESAQRHHVGDVARRTCCAAPTTGSASWSRRSGRAGRPGGRSPPQPVPAAATVLVAGLGLAGLAARGDARAPLPRLVPAGRAASWSALGYAGAAGGPLAGAGAQRCSTARSRRCATCTSSTRCCGCRLTLGLCGRPGPGPGRRASARGAGVRGQDGALAARRTRPSPRPSPSGCAGPPAAGGHRVPPGRAGSLRPGSFAAIPAWWQRDGRLAGGARRGPGAARAGVELRRLHLGTTARRAARRRSAARRGRCATPSRSARPAPPGCSTGSSRCWRPGAGRRTWLPRSPGPGSGTSCSATTSHPTRLATPPAVARAALVASPGIAPVAAFGPPVATTACRHPRHGRAACATGRPSRSSPSGPNRSPQVRLLTGPRTGSAAARRRWPAPSRWTPVTPYVALADGGPIRRVLVTDTLRLRHGTWARPPPVPTDRPCRPARTRPRDALPPTSWRTTAPSASAPSLSSAPRRSPRRHPLRTPSPPTISVPATRRTPPSTA